MLFDVGAPENFSSSLRRRINSYTEPNDDVLIEKEKQKHPAVGGLAGQREAFPDRCLNQGVPTIDFFRSNFCDVILLSSSFLASLLFVTSLLRKDNLFFFYKLGPFIK